MSTMATKDFEGKKVFAQQGREVGVVEALEIDLKHWKIVAVLVKLRRQVLEELNLKRPLVGTQSLRLGIEHVSGISDTVVLSSQLEDLVPQ